MKKTVCAVLAMALVPFCAFAVDGVVLINQSTVTAAGGFPYTISQAGSYKLSGNLLVPSGVAGIQITASNVTLDLNGFNITGNSSFSQIFILTVGTLKGVTVRNGTISTSSEGFQFGVVDFRGTSGTVLEDLTLRNLNGFPEVSLGSSVIVRRVSYPNASLFVTCPAVVVDSLAGGFVRDTTSSTACTFGNSSGSVF